MKGLPFISKALLEQIFDEWISVSLNPNILHSVTDRGKNGALGNVQPLVVPFSPSMTPLLVGRPFLVGHFARMTGIKGSDAMQYIDCSIDYQK